MTGHIDRDDLRTRLDERPEYTWPSETVSDLLAALDQAEARIAAVDAELLYAELHGNDEVWTHNIRRALDGEA